MIRLIFRNLLLCYSIFKGTHTAVTFYILDQIVETSGAMLEEGEREGERGRETEGGREGEREGASTLHWWGHIKQIQRESNRRESDKTFRFTLTRTNISRL